MIQPVSGLQQAGKSARSIAVKLRQTRTVQTIYLASGKLGLPLVIYSCSLVNLIFWGNLSTWVYSDYTVKNKQNENYELASLKQRSIYSGALATLGVCISTGFALVSKRVVKRIDILPGGSSVKLHTGFFRRSATDGGITIPISELSLRKSMYTGVGNNQAISSQGSFTQLLKRNQLIGYLIDRRGLFLTSPKIMDELFFHSTSSK